MSPEKRERVAHVMQMIREDLPRDMELIEGAPLNGRVVSEAFGRLAAQVDALAHAVIVILENES